MAEDNQPIIDIQLTQEREGKHQQPASDVFSEPEIDTNRPIHSPLLPRFVW